MHCNETYLNYWRYCSGQFCFIIILFYYSESYVINLLCLLLLLNVAILYSVFFSFTERYVEIFSIMIRLR
jgi:hypothetical protein